MTGPHGEPGIQYGAPATKTFQWARKQSDGNTECNALLVLQQFLLTCDLFLYQVCDMLTYCHVLKLTLKSTAISNCYISDQPLSKHILKMADNDVDVNEELLDYEDDPETETPAAEAGAENGAAKQEGKVKGNYVSIHSSGFHDFLLKPEVLRAIVDCGFEHPSEIQHECIPQVTCHTSVL